MRSWRRFALLSGLACGLAHSSCGGGPAPTAGPTGPKSAGASAKKIIDGRVVLSERCGGCHNEKASQAGLDLVSDNLAGRIVNKPSELCEGFVLADPSDPESSLLYKKLSDEPGCGDTMPPAGIEGPNPDEVRAIRDWISGLSVAAAGSCTPRETRKCEIGNPLWWSVCEQPTQMCSAAGDRWGECGAGLPGVENCTTEADEDCNPGTPANTCSDKRWSFAVARERSQLFESVGVDKQGNVYVLGNFQGIADFGAGDLSSDEPRGQYKNDVFLGKYDKFGTPIWTKDYGDSSNQYGPRLAVHPESGDVAVIVRLFGGISFGDGSPHYKQKGSGDIVVAVFDSDGNHRWSHQLGGRANDRAERIAWAADNSGDLIVSGKAGDHGAKPLAIPGKGVIDPKGKADGLVVRFAPNGDVRWHAVLGGRQLIEGDTPPKGAGGRCDPGDGSNYRRCKGCGAQRCDPKTSRWESSCKPLQKPNSTFMFPCGRSDLVCSQEKASSGLCISGDDDYAWGAVSDGDGNVYVTGRFEGYMDFPKLDGARNVERASHGSRDIFVLKLDGATGNPIWSKHFGSTGDDRAYDIALQKDSGNLIVTGYFSGTVAFGGTTLVAKGGAADDDIFVLSLDAAKGSTVWAKGYGDGVSQFGHGHELGKSTRQISLEIDEHDNIYLGGTLYGSFDGRIASIMGSKGPRPDPFFVKLSPRGSYLNGRVHGSSSSEFGADIALDPSTDSILLVGHMYSDSLDFGSSGKVLGIKNAADAFIVKFQRP